MGSEICNKIKPWIFHSKIIPNVSCSVSLLLPLLPALHLPWHHPSINAPPLIKASITAMDQMAPILLAQPQHSHGTCQVELAACVYLTFTFFVIVHHADNCFVFFSIHSREITYVQALHIFLAHCSGPVSPFTGLHHTLDCEPLREKNRSLQTSWQGDSPCPDWGHHKTNKGKINSTFKSPWSLFLQQFISLCQCKVTLPVSFALC